MNKEEIPTKKRIIGFKVFNPDLTCSGNNTTRFQYEIGKDYKHSGEIKICKSGFHFCLKASHCFSYYSFDPKNIVCEVEALGEIEIHKEDSKIVTNHIKILRQLEWSEVLMVANEGINNLGYGNAGNSNAGNYNAGNDNAGNYNAGNRNAGNRNAGNRNAGYRNAGNDNAGNHNAGNRNAGNYNAGNRNAGYSNAGNDNAGAFNTIESFMMFNKKSKWTFKDFRESKAFELLHHISTTMWIQSSAMSEQEKKDHPYYVTILGYVKNIPYKEAFTNTWNNWSDSNKQVFKDLPGFDAEVFFECTGVKV